VARGRRARAPRRRRPRPPPPAAADADSNGLSIVALVLGALGLLIGIAALVVARRGAASPGR
jgi:hypothetical protein